MQTLIEKHFYAGSRDGGADHQASLEPNELASMVAGIGSVEIALGSAIKSPTVSELNNRNVVRKSLVAAKDIAKGEA